MGVKGDEGEKDVGSEDGEMLPLLEPKAVDDSRGSGADSKDVGLNDVEPAERAVEGAELDEAAIFRPCGAGGGEVCGP